MLYFATVGCLKLTHWMLPTTPRNKMTPDKRRTLANGRDCFNTCLASFREEFRSKQHRFGKA